MYLKDGERKLTVQNSPVCTTLAASTPRSTAARAWSSAYNGTVPGRVAPRLCAHDDSLDGFRLLAQTTNQPPAQPPERLVVVGSKRQCHSGYFFFFFF